MKMHETTFYDDHPFNWTTNYDSVEVAATLAPLLASFVGGVPPDAWILDIGCGAGRVMASLVARNLRCLGLDLSRNSVRLMTENTGAAGVVASNLRLPFADGAVDRAVSDGVIHHISDSFGAFTECCRVLKTSGLLYLAVYKPNGHYQALYRFPGAVIRHLLKYRIGKALVQSTMLPFYFLVHFAKSRGKTTWSGATNLFYDYFVTPVVMFFSREDIESWSMKCGVEIVSYDANPRLNVHSFLLRKAETPNAGIHSFDTTTTDD